MSDEVLIRAENVGKKFCRSLKKSLMYGVQDVGFDLLGIDRSGAGLRKAEFWANQGISFELRRGECLGLIGRNGAGKTTLLKILNGLIKPDRGRIEMRGRVGALIALGAGFNPILTGRENVYVAASVLGFSKKEISNRFDDIVDFAEINEFIDTPVQSYSSGMQVRLGFAVASSLDPDILLIDEVLAVGDASFRVKCMNRIRERLYDKTACIFVSHNEGQIKNICTHGIMLEKGEVKKMGEVKNVMNWYKECEGNTRSREYKNIDGIIKNIKIENIGDHIVATISKDNVNADTALGVEIKSETDHAILNTKIDFSKCRESETKRVEIDITNLTPNVYYIAFALFQKENGKIIRTLDVVTNKLSFVKKGVDNNDTGYIKGIVTVV